MNDLDIRKTFCDSTEENLITESADERSTYNEFSCELEALGLDTKTKIKINDAADFHAVAAKEQGYVLGYKRTMADLLLGALGLREVIA